MSGSAVLHRVVRSTPELAEHGKGCLIATAPMAIKDMSSGAGVTCLGYSAHRIKFAIQEAVNILPYVHAANFTTPSVENFAKQLLEECGPPFERGRAVFWSGGAEAVEAACKIGLQYFREVDNAATPTFWGRRYSYHGNTVFTLALGDHPRKRTTHLSNAYFINRLPAYAPSRRHSTVDAAVLPLENAVKGGRPFIVVVETIGGTTIGIEPSRCEYLARLRHVCDQYGGLLIYDEILCGNYRTGDLFAWQAYQRQTEYPLAPDIIIAGKGLTGGYFPLSACIVSEKIASAIIQGSGRLWHSSTNQNHTIGCAAGIAALQSYKEAASARSALVGQILAVRAAIAAMPLVQDVIGEGALWGIRLEPNIADLHKVVRQDLLKRGLAFYSDGGTIDGRGNMLLLAPPYCMTGEQLGAAIHVIGQSLEQIAQSGQRAA